MIKILGQEMIVKEMKRCLLSVVTIGCLFPCLPSYGEDWSYQIEPYGQFTSIDGDTGIGRVDGAPVDVGFDDILENLELAGMIHFEALHQSGWGIALDYGFMKLGAKKTGPRGGV
jgi:hypothetical protein